MARELKALPEDPVVIWEPTGEYVECIADGQAMNGRIGIDFTTWHRVNGIDCPVYGTDPLIMSADQVDAAKAALDSGNPNPNSHLIAPFCLGCGNEPALWTVSFCIEPFFVWMNGKRVMVDRLGFGENCIELASRLVGAERARLKKKELVNA